MNLLKRIRSGLGGVLLSLAFVLTLVCGVTFNISPAQAALPSDGVMEVDFIDLGQSDATLIICGGHTILIDAGDNNKGTELQSYLEYMGVDKIDLFVVTHFHSDHCGGADVIITKFDVDELLVSDLVPDTAVARDVFSAAQYKNLKYRTPAAGETFMVGDMRVDIIAPAYDTYTDPNNSSIGLIVTYGDTSFLFAGDAEEEAERAMLSAGIELGADVYQVNHHGSRTSSCDDFLNAVNPTYAVISCGEGNSYGHPHAAPLNSLRMMGVKVFRTDEQGTIAAYSDGTNITWNCSPSESWLTGGVQTAIDDDTVEGYSESARTYDQSSSAKNTGETYYIGNANSKKFHYSWCDSVTKMAEHNKVDLSGYTRDQIINIGYSPCGACNP